jgi:hypothetical protein
MTDADLTVRITALKQAVSKAKAAIEQRRAQSAANAKLQAPSSTPTGSECAENICSRRLVWCGKEQSLLYPPIATSILSNSRQRNKASAGSCRQASGSHGK